MALYAYLSATAAAHVTVAVLRQLLRASNQAAGSADVTALAVLVVLEALALCCGFGFGGFGGSCTVQG